MATRGRRLAAYGTIISVLTLGLTAPAALADADEPDQEASGETNDVVVLAITTEDGAETDLVTDAATATATDAATSDLITAALEVPEFYVAAATWDGPEDPGAQIAIRVETEGEWTAWSELEPEAGEDVEDGGTEPYIVGGATGVQLRVGPVGTLPSNLRLHLIPAEPTMEESQATTEEDVAELSTQAQTNSTESGTASMAAPTSATASAPRVITRSGWRADESKMTWTPSNRDLRAAVVHHTAGTNNYTAAQSPAIVQGIYHFHAVTRGWGDIGYNFLVDKYGQVFEGRTGSFAAPHGQMPQAAHALGFNDGTLGISVLGDYSAVHAPESILDTMAEVIAWKFAAAGIDMATPSGMTSPGTSARPRGQNLPRVFAHRDVGSTTCPGNNIYARMAMINEKVATLVDGDEYHLRNDLAGGPAHLAFSLGLSTDEVLVGDWNGNGRDTLALRRGNMYLVYDRHPGQQFRVIRYGRANDVVLVGDWNGDGRDTFAVRRGSAYHVKNSMTGGDADVVINYGRANDTVLVGDWNGNGRDTFAVRRGSIYHVKNSMTGGDADVVINYGRANDTVLVGDWNGNGRDTFAIRRGQQYHIRNTLSGGDAHVVLRYGRADDVVLVGDWNGDGRDTFGVRR
ncbi:N-acetylmuramoyl-L-alanine amidase [Pseudactinotalea sp. Z1748]|uniref:N-acetylmuramoyl-L-alanine amidase n=1 Tax=Pseudactinotalea sp. Z1748 TaxID=3413027 RepID=UPI003C7DC952